MAVAISTKFLQAYKEGVMPGEGCGEDREHAVVIVGYGSDNGKDYWIVKNSYGEKWGKEGYFWLERGVNACGVTGDVSVVEIK